MLSAPITPFLTPEGAFVFTLTNNGYKYLTYNLSCHIQSLKVPWKLCILCADIASFRFFKNMGISCLRFQVPLPEFGTDPSLFGSKQFQTLNLKKLELLSTFSSDPAIRFGIYLDGDIVVYSDFLPDILSRLTRSTSPTFYLQCDEQTRVDCSGTPYCPNACTGFLAWSHGVDTRLFTIDKTTWNQCPEDQVYVNTMLHRLSIPFQTLPRHLYPNGAFASLYNNGSLRKTGTHILHYNYLVGAAKRKKMMNNGDWIIPY
jgi:hypothetical protein